MIATVPRAVLGVALLSLSALLPAQDPFTKTLRGGGFDLRKVSLPEFVAAMRAEGRIRAPADLLAAKRAYRAVAGKTLRGKLGAASQRPLHVPAATGTWTAPLAAITETERNDTPAWADPLGTQTSADGNLATPVDQDTYRLELAADTAVNAAVVAGTTGVPTTDPALLVTDRNGVFVAFNDDAGSGFFPALNLILPAGTYYFTVATLFSATGTYQFNLQTAPATLGTVVPGVSINATLGANGVVYRLPLAAESKVKVTVQGGTLDLNLTGGGRNYGEVFFCDDGSTGLDPGWDTTLPAGVYYLTFGEYNGLTGPFTFRVDVTAASIPGAPCGTGVNGTILGDESMDVYRLVVPTGGVDFTVAGNGASPLSDSWLHLYDREFRFIAHNDDNQNSYFSKLAMPLPGATYYVVMRPYPGDSGGYTLNGVCGANIPFVNASFGANAGNVANVGESAGYRLRIGTPSPLTVLADTTNGTLQDPQIALLDATGLCVAQNEDFGPNYDSFAGAALGTGDHYVLVRDWNNQTGTFLFGAEPRLFYIDAQSNKTLISADKAGRQVFALAAVSLLGTPVPLPPPIQGNLLIDLTISIGLGTQTIPAGGTVQWPYNFTPYNVVLQGVSLDSPVTTLIMTNDVR